MDLLWKLAGIIGPIAITALSVALVLLQWRTKKERLNVEALIERMLYWYVTNAEQQLGGGTGSLKLAAVISWVYNALPEKYKTAFSYDELAAMVEKALAAAKELWEKSPALLGTEAVRAVSAVGFDTSGE